MMDFTTHHMVDDELDLLEAMEAAKQSTCGSMQTKDEVAQEVFLNAYQLGGRDLAERAWREFWMAKS